MHLPSNILTRVAHRRSRAMIFRSQNCRYACSALQDGLAYRIASSTFLTRGEAGIPDTRAFRVVGWKAGTRADPLLRSPQNLSVRIALKRGGA